MTWEWISNDRIFIFGWTNTLNDSSTKNENSAYIYRGFKYFSYTGGGLFWWIIWDINPRETLKKAVLQTKGFSWEMGEHIVRSLNLDRIVRQVSVTMKVSLLRHCIAVQPTLRTKTCALFLQERGYDWKHGGCILSFLGGFSGVCASKWGLLQRHLGLSVLPGHC